MRKTICILLFLSFCISSCAPVIFFGAGTAAGVAGYKYYQGALMVIYQASFEETYEATQSALEKMDIKSEGRTKEPTSGKIKAQLSDGKAVTIGLKYRSAEETEVVIRVGLFGDENASMVIKEEIRKELFK